MVVVDNVMKHEIKRTYRYRIYPNSEQRQELARTFGCSRWVYNWALETKTKAYYQDEESLSFTDLSSRLTSKKKEEETEWLSEVSAVTLQQSLRNLNQAFTNFFEGRAEYPSFKSKKAGQTARYVGTAFDIREENGKRKLRLSKMPGLINIRWSRELPSEPSSCTVTKNAAGQYHVCFVCTEEVRRLPRVNGEGGDLEFVGVDLGIESLAVLSTGEKVGNPRWFENEYKRLRCEQQKLSRKEKGSNNWERQRKRVAKVHQRIQDRRKDFIEKLTTRLVEKFDVIVVEDLSVKNMQQNGKLARHITQAGWSQIVRRLRDKCKWYGRTLVIADKWFPSSQRCSECGHVDGKKSLDVRDWTCDECGTCHDRDINAAKNLSRVGQTRIQAPGDLGKPDAFEVVGSGR
ncbi:putative transposase [Salinibacter ruber]|uniref:RNA-guided endonuclease InsQ/TnpB family protein n=1 Tax=Salinibacter ruber TaxID=146919 RepID=UPI00216AA7E9|nr:transposase [Salinibacter ruber]MCS3626857.1 putative transposase [Salinibacter ruber]MCS3650512.1 putative transposase [Salinibacter ruber]MCS3653764.1 putative transposase [Salinibacter ruber]MCS4143890.1 putative transposase [Salinibacter ruber]MCS4194163.1 putative transposase [Salinibacter ruber]